MLNTIKNNLPSIVTFKPITQCEYHGFGYSLAHELNIHAVPIIHSTGIIHSWIYQSPEYIEELTFGGTFSKLLVGTQKDVDFMNRKGYYDVHAIGTPYIYINANLLDHIQRIPNSLLVMPLHSLDSTRQILDEESYVKEILKIKDNFDLVVFCIHQKCEQQSLWIDTLEKYNLPYILGASIDDKNSLLRVHSIFKQFEYMTTNSLGSHIAYASYSGCKVSIYGTFHEVDRNSIAHWRSYKKAPYMIERHLYLTSEKYAREKFSQFFANNPKEAVLKTEWAKEILGEEFKLNIRKLAELLGWIINGVFVYSECDSALKFNSEYGRLYRFIERLNLMNKKFIIYGAGTVGKTIQALLPNSIVCFVDINSNKTSEEFISKEVYSVDNLTKIQYDYIIISVLGRETAIKEFLFQKYNISEEKILCFNIKENYL